jgi:Tfp pilus assembly major pilin PilA
MMIVVAIIAILAAVLAPNVSTYMRRAKGSAAANDITGVLRSARNQAMSRGEVILATVTTHNGVVDGGGTIVLERTDNPGAPGCDAVDMDTTTDPDCFARSCAQAQAMGTTNLFTYDLGNAHPDMIIQNTDPAPTDNELTLCFEPSGRVLGSNGLPLSSDSAACDAVNSRLFVRLDADGDLDDNPIASGSSLSECLTVDEASQASIDARQEQKDGRDVVNFYSITVPFNGAISAKQ